MTVAHVAVPRPIDELFTYLIPDGLALEVGHAVVVPFGRQTMTGYVVALSESSERAGLRAVERLLDAEPVFGPEELPFFRWVADYYLASLGEVIATALPSGYRGEARRVLEPTDEGVEALAQGTVEEPRATLLREIILRPGRTRRSVVQGLHGEVEATLADRALDALHRAGLVRFDERTVAGPGGRITVVELKGLVPDRLPTGARMKSVLARLEEAGGRMDLSELVRLEGGSARDAVRRLEEKGWLRLTEREDISSVSMGELPGRVEAHALNAEQEAAVATVLASPPAAVLMHGVTGSGKTEVYLHLAARVLDQGGEVLVLVPEIALTPQLTGRFRARFGDRIAVLHSGLTPAERLREWRRIRAGKAPVVVGARSALFAPLARLGLVIVDEEHDDSYKQDEGVRYHARDLAVVRAHRAKVPVVLGSATPSLESWQNARDGRYRLARLVERATPRPVPRIELVDLCGRPPDPLSAELRQGLEDTFARGGKAIVLYNRRGYAPVVQCPGCGGHYDCPSCGVGMVLHQRQGRLTCHYCGFHRPFVAECPACNTPFEVLGHGTERIEELLVQAFPTVAVGRLDADTTASRGSLLRILERFRVGELRLLVGTQLVAKGHDFPGVHLAAVVGADHVLTLPDFRSAERTHALVTQVAGRAGRGDEPGRVIVQTYHPDHFVFQVLSREESQGDLDAFYEEEVKHRRALGYPPFARLVLVRAEGADRDATLAAARALARDMRQAIDEAHQGRIEVLGPTPAPLARLVGRWRFQIILRGRDVPAFRAWLRQVRGALQKPPGRGVRLVVDIDPRSLL